MSWSNSKLIKPSAPAFCEFYDEDETNMAKKPGKKNALNSNAKANYQTISSPTKPLVSPLSTRRQIEYETPTLIYVCQGILSNTTLRSNLYIIFIFVLSYLGHHLKKYQDLVYTAQPGNILNEYFVKLGWAWTTALLVPFVFLTNGVLGGFGALLAGFLRLLVATAVWAGGNALFDMLRHNGQDRLDLSGHSFILIWSIMVIIEESKAYDGWESIMSEVNNTRSPSKTSVQTSRLMTFCTLPVRVLLIMMSILCILWDIMFISTVLFFHTWIEKLMATALALMAWLVLYHGVYTLPPPGSSAAGPRAIGQTARMRSLA